MNEAEEKAIGQFMMRVGATLGQFFTMYGMEVGIPACKEVLKLHALELHRRLNQIRPTPDWPYKLP